MRLVPPIFGILPFLLFGCGAAPHPPTEWVRQQGGLVCDGRQGRAAMLLARLVDRTDEARVRVYVLSSDDLSAHSWADGSVYVTRGLVDQLTDDELLAAMAHELGHLMRGGQVSASVSLRGCDRGGTCVDEEERADAIGLDLLKARGVPAGAMASMLEKVAIAEEPASPCHRALLRRIDVLASHLRPAAARLQPSN